MFDMHYDLLTLAYMAGPNNEKLNFLFKECESKKGITANLYFMSKEENKKELNYPNNIDVVQMFKEAKTNLESYKLSHKILYSIEGCDYIKDENELETLKKNGLNAIILVWNNENKYGSGNRTNKGLTEEGKKFIQKAIDLNLGIDLSHANKQTYEGIIKEVKRKGGVCYASHSNIRYLHDHPRNLSKKQLSLLKEVDGYLGLVAYPKFLTKSKDIKDIKEAYIKNILEAINVLGINRVFLATDNMNFLDYFKGRSGDASPYEYDKVQDELRESLKPYLNEEEINKIMYENASKLYERLICK